MIPIAALLSVTTITLADLQENGELPGAKEWLGIGVVFGMLSAGADLGLPIVSGMATLVMVVILLTRGPEAFEFLLGKLEPEKKPSRKPFKPYRLKKDDNTRMA